MRAILHQLETAVEPLADGDCIPKLANLEIVHSEATLRLYSLLNLANP